MGRGAIARRRRRPARPWPSVKQVLGEHHPDTALSLNNLGDAAEGAGDYAAAKPLLEQALAIRQAVLGEHHPDTAISLNNLAALLKDAGGLRRRQAPPRAGPGYLQAGLWRAPSPLRHQPEQPGGVLQDQGDYAGAKPLYEQALAIRKEVLGAPPRHRPKPGQPGGVAAGRRGTTPPPSPSSSRPWPSDKAGIGRAPPRHRHKA